MKFFKNIICAVTLSIVTACFSGAVEHTYTCNPSITLLSALSISVDTHPDFGKVNSDWTSGETLVLDTADNITGTGISNHFGGQDSGEATLTASGSTSIAATLDVTTTQPDNTNLLFSSPVCKIGGGNEGACSSLAGTAAASTTIKVGATLTINTNSVPVTPTNAVEGATWTLTINCS